jgi:hypothetical protein
LAHNNQFKTQQAERVGCALSGRVPPAFGEAIEANPDPGVNAARDPDLAAVRGSGLLEASP